MQKKYICIIIISFFLQNCILENLSECGKLSKCKNKNRVNFLSAIVYRLLTKPPRAGIFIDAVNLSGADDNPAVYDGFAGRIDNSTWNEQKVLDILQDFAYGGGATQADITAWVNMGPSKAIVEMIGMWTINPKLAVASSGDNIRINPVHGSLSHLSHNYGTTGPAVDRSGFDQRNLSWVDSPARTFVQAVATRGLNPVRQKIAFLETNYHMTINQDKDVSDVQMFRHYDTIANDIARSHRDTLGYEDVLANIAISAPVATQYNHKKNVFENGKFKGNEDFAREYHQLFFGILGVGTDRSGLNNKDSIPVGNAESFNEHENTTIPKTACALTDIQVAQAAEFADSDIATYGTSKHCPGSLSIYAQPNTGNRADQRIRTLSKLSIAHLESLDTLPLIIVSGLADENLDSAKSLITDAADTNITPKIATIRNIWRSIPRKNLIEFIRKYAISTAYHNATRVKFVHTVDRTLTNANTTVVTNQELSNGFVRYDYEIYTENIRAFRPVHDVFGGQTGLEASNTDDVFGNVHNSMVSGQYGAIGFWNNATSTVVRLKDYRTMLPKSSNITTLEVAQFLWKRLLGDASLAYFGSLERAHLVALLSTGRDLSYFSCGSAITKVTDCPAAVNSTPITESQVNSTFSGIISTAAAKNMFAAGASQASIDDDNERVGSAVDFILATPFNLVHLGGRP
jgi:hypothetical protein